MKNLEEELMQFLLLLGNEKIEDEGWEDWIYGDYSDFTFTFSHIKSYKLSPKTHRTLKVCAQSGYDTKLFQPLGCKGSGLKSWGLRLE